MKAAEDSRTPRRCREPLRVTPSARSWSAAVLCRFWLVRRDRRFKSRGFARRGIEFRPLAKEFSFRLTSDRFVVCAGEGSSSYWQRVFWWGLVWLRFGRENGK